MFLGEWSTARVAMWSVASAGLSVSDARVLAAEGVSGLVLGRPIAINHSILFTCLVISSYPRQPATGRPCPKPRVY